MRRIVTIALVAALAVAGAPTTTTAAVSIGLSDQEASAFVHPLFTWTGITRARVVVRWDVSLGGPERKRERDDLTQWLQTTRNLGIEPLVSFQRPRGDDCRGEACRLPTVTDYRAAMTAFHRQWPWVRAISPWNEANHPSQPTAAHPEAAALYYEIAREVCADCQVIGAEVLDIPNMAHWLARFQAAVHPQPQLWALHNYGDVTRQDATMSERMLRAVGGEVWITETGGIVRFEMPDGSVPWPYDEQRARRSVEFAFSLADAHPDRFTRLYLYNWRSPPWMRWDSALLSFAGEPRPSFAALAARLRPGTAPPAAARVSIPRAWVARRPRLGRDRWVRAILACRADPKQICDVAMTVRARRGRRLGDAARGIRGGRLRSLRVRVSRARLRRLARRRHCRLNVRVWVGRPAPLRYRVRCRPRR